ncbi:hypothetical protein LZ554_000241 [Drepanopeziza brunnea f. sp. 'monogermtubi']|nr:hypothetical protein LZ554_000241 [Drepanopeziza brunnea f. sp. 'monogermtubi']
MAQITSTAAEFVETKIQSLESEVVLYLKQRRCMEDAFEAKVLTKQQLKDALEDAPSQEELDTMALKVDMVKKRRKFIEDDLAEMEVSPDQLENAYSSLMIGRFKKAVLERYGATRMEGENQLQYCVVTGEWFYKLDSKGENYPVVAAHLVPRLLNGDDLDYLFGIKDGLAIPSDPANALPLHTRIESALDNAEIVIVPRLKAGKQTEWEVFSPDKQSGRPSKRYLYFRFVMSYLILLKRNEPGSMKWVKNIEAKGTVWATPGPYLRKSMLMTLARKVSDKYPPPGLVDPNTFDELPYDPPLGDLEKYLAASTLANKIIGLTDNDIGTDSEADD